MKRKWLNILKLFGLILALSACTTTSEAEVSQETLQQKQLRADFLEDKTIDGSYSIHVEGQDWGAAVTKALLRLNIPVDSVNRNTFLVRETKQITDYNDENLPIVENTVERQVVDAYLLDEEGNRTDLPSCYVILELGFDRKSGSPLLYNENTGYDTWSSPYYLTFTISEDASLESEGVKVESINIDEDFTFRTTSADSFKAGSFEAPDGIEYDYALFEPEEECENLFVFLHGFADGGAAMNGDLTDPYVALLANEAANLASSEFQKTVGNAAILVPQAPTYWMDGDGEGTNYYDGVIHADGTSYYLESLHELISSVREQTGAKKVIIGGISSGGYMSMLMALTYGHEYDGYLLVCEYYTDELISDTQIESLKDIPLYFIWADTDPVVDPNFNEIPTVERLKAVDADVQVARLEKVLDTSGLYPDEDGSQHEYSGHSSWIYFFNDEAISEDGISSWQWIASIFNGTEKTEKN